MNTKKNSSEYPGLYRLELTGGSDCQQEVGKVKQTVTRAYHIPCYPNQAKLGTAKYLINRFILYTNYCVSREFFNQRIESTSGLGQLFNQANYKSKQIIKKQNASTKETNNKKNIPNLTKERPPVKFEKSKNTNYDYVVKVSNQWEKKGLVEIPVNSTKVLNKALKSGWRFTNFGEIFIRNNKLYLTVFVQKEVSVAKPRQDNIGVDVGINKSITTSESHYGPSLSPIIKKFKESQRERYRQRTKFNQKQTLKKNGKTYLKQILNKEAKGVVTRCHETNSNLIVESRKTLNNLRTGKLSLWARNHFANRVEVLSKENEVFFLEVNPYKSSQSCNVCRKEGHRDKQEFVCKNTSCSEYLISADADLNASKELRNRGRQVIEEKILPRYNQVAVKNRTRA